MKKLEQSYTPRIRARVVIPVILLAIVWWHGLYTYVVTNNEELVRRSEQQVRDTKAHLELLAKVKAARLKREAAANAVTAKTITDTLVGQIDAGATPTMSPNILQLTCNYAYEHADPAKPDVLVNKQHCIKPLNYAPKDLLSDGEVTLARSAYEAYQAMKQAARTEGIVLTPTSSYRSFTLQVTSYTDWYRTLGSAKRASEVSALPGYSEHQLGLAVDLRAGGCALECFRSTSTYAWLRAHAHEHGFIERYPEGKTDVTGYGAEAWHWRYVGKATAADMRIKGMSTLEEYYDLPGGS